jgi:hypothetical protein
MRELVERIINCMNEMNLNSEDITTLIDTIIENQNASSSITRDICEDDLEVLRLARLLIIKFLDIGENNQINISGNDWRSENINFSLLRFWLDDFEINRFISHKLLGIGGQVFFIIVRRRDFLSYIYDEIRSVLNRLRLPTLTSDEGNEISIPEPEISHELDIIATLNPFKQCVERDGWRAFWNGGSLNNELKNCAEEIGKSQFMAFLKGFGINFEIKHNTFQEVQEGSGYSDVVHIDERSNKYVFELKIWKGPVYFQTGITELESYLSHEELDEGYYIIFDKRKRQKRVIENPITTESGKTIHIIQIDIAPTSPTAN